MPQQAVVDVEEVGSLWEVSVVEGAEMVEYEVDE